MILMPTHELMPQYFFRKLKIQQGFFVDVGANDGNTGSMSYELENYGWQGILIEPNPVLVDLLKARRKSPVFQNAIAKQAGSFDFFIVEGPSNLHGLSRLAITDDFCQHVKKHQGVIKKETVQCLTLTQLLEHHPISQVPSIDFLKIDVEGFELDVLQGIELNKFSPKVIVTEDNTKDQNPAVRKYLAQNGYTVVARSGTNNWYVKNELASDFVFQRLKANYTFARWALKRTALKMIGRKYKSNYI